MIALSSFRPKAQASPEIWRNQVEAVKSWKSAFIQNIFFNDFEPEFNDGPVYFVPCKEKPTIKVMAEMASKLPMWAAIVNADIIIAPDFLEVIGRMLKHTGAKAAVSGRYNFHPGQPLETAQITDNGLDFFAAHPAIWARVAREIPPEFTLGKCLWDTWMISAFSHITNGMMADLTENRLVFHPFHEERGIQGLDDIPRLQQHPYLKNFQRNSIRVS